MRASRLMRRRRSGCSTCSHPSQSAVYRLTIDDRCCELMFAAPIAGWAGTTDHRRFDRGSSRSNRTGPRFRGRTMLRTPAAAIRTCAWSLGIAEAIMNEGLRTYPGLPHRMERVRETRRRHLRQRQQGDQPDRDGAGAGGVSGDPLDPAAGGRRATISTSARRTSAMSARPTPSARRRSCSSACLNRTCR